MDRLSFFKLPLIFVTLYFCCDSGVSIVKIAIEMIPLVDGYGDLWTYLLTFLPYQLYRLIPDCLLLFGISSIALHRINVHVVTAKNVILLAINVLILLALIYLLGFMIFEILDAEFIKVIYIETWLFVLLVRSVPLILFYLLGGLLTYYFIKALGDQFDRDKQPFVLTNTNSPKIHFTLFLVFFFFIAMGLYSLIIDAWIQQSYDPIAFGNYLFVPHIITIISVLIVILVTKNVFTQPFVVLQSDRIVKSAILSNVLIFILNIIFVVVELIIFISMVFDHSMVGQMLLALLIFTLLLQVLLSCFIIRKVVKGYFYRTITSKI